MASSPDPTHPDLLALDALRAGEGSSEDRAHVAACDSCRTALSELERIAGAVQAGSGQSPEVPVEVDRAILALARVELSRIRRRQPARLWRWGAAAAAACILAGVATFLALPHRPGQEIAHVDLPGRPGATVDIVDAYQLAVALRSREPVDRAWDWNRDGLVDGKDVDAIAIESVSLARRTK